MDYCHQGQVVVRWEGRDFEDALVEFQYQEEKLNLDLLCVVERTLEKILRGEADGAGESGEDQEH